MLDRYIIFVQKIYQVKNKFIPYRCSSMNSNIKFLLIKFVMYFYINIFDCDGSTKMEDGEKNKNTICLKNIFPSKYNKYIFYFKMSDRDPDYTNEAQYNEIFIIEKQCYDKGKIIESTKSNYELIYYDKSQVVQFLTQIY